MSQSGLDPATFKLILSKLVKTPQQFTGTDIQRAIDHVITPGAALPEQVGSFLTGLAIARLELREDVLLAAVNSIYSRSIPAVITDADKDFIVDIVGTGGDGHNTFNVSTTAAIAAAGAGARVVKVNAHISTPYTIPDNLARSAARQPRIDVVQRLCRPPAVPRVCLRSAAQQRALAHPQHPTDLHPRAALSPRTRRTGPRTACSALPHALQRPRAPSQPSTTG
jgi:hypothetical protein